MPPKSKRTSKSPPAKRRRASTPQERGDTDFRGAGSAYAQDNVPREPVAGQRREPQMTPARPQTARTRGVEDDEAPAITPDDAKAYRLASLRARRRGLH